MCARTLPDGTGKLDQPKLFEEAKESPGASSAVALGQHRAWIECVFHEHGAFEFEKQILQARPLSPPVS